MALNLPSVAQKSWIRQVLLSRFLGPIAGVELLQHYRRCIDELNWGNIMKFVYSYYCRTDIRKELEMIDFPVFCYVSEHANVDTTLQVQLHLKNVEYVTLKQGGTMLTETQPHEIA